MSETWGKNERFLFPTWAVGIGIADFTDLRILATKTRRTTEE